MIYSIEDNLNLFFYKQRVLIILSLLEKEKTATDIYFENKIVYGYVSNQLKFFEKIGIVKSRSEGRKKYYFLTTEGREIAEYLKNIYEKIKEKKI